MTTTAASRCAGARHAPHARPSRARRRIPARRLVIVCRALAHTGRNLGRGDLVVWAAETEELAQRNQASPIATPGAGLSHGVQRHELVVGRATEKPVLDAALHEDRSSDDRFDLRQAMQWREAFKVAVILDRFKAHVPPAHVVLCGAKCAGLAVGAAGVLVTEFHARKLATRAGRNWTARPRRMV